MVRGWGRFRSLAAAAVVAATAVLGFAFGDNGPVIVSVNSSEAAADDWSLEASVSNSGKFVVFRSIAQNLSPLAIGDDLIYLRDRGAGTTTMVSEVDDAPFVDGCYNPVISGNGRWVLFASDHQGLPPDDTPDSDLYLYDRRTRSMRVVSVNGDGDLGNSGTYVDGAAISANGRYGVAHSTATNLTADTGDKTYEQVYLFDFRKGTVTMLTKGIDGNPGNGSSGRASISANGRWVAFDSQASNLVAGIGNGTYQAFLYDVRHGTLVHASPASGGGAADGFSIRPAVTNAGVVVFGSLASDLLAAPDADGTYDVFRFDPRDGGSMTLLTRTAEDPAPPGSAERCAVSQSGKLVVFSTTQSLDSSDDNGDLDIYSLDVPTGTLRLVTRDTDGNASGNGDSDLVTAGLSPNGRWLAFFTTSTNLAPGDGNASVYDVLLVDPRK